MIAFACAEMCVQLERLRASTPSLNVACRFRDAVERFQIPVQWRRPTPLTSADWQTVHAADYLTAVFAGDADTFAAASLTPTAELMTAMQYAAGSLVDATAFVSDRANALCALSPTSSWHHAHYDRPGVFCVLNALVLAALRALAVDRVEQLLILDADYHIGNGTEDILGKLGEDRIHHISLGRWFTKPSQSHEYIRKMEEISATIQAGRYGLVIYQAGMDVLLGDPAGGLLTFGDAMRRDEIVFAACAASQTPVVWNFAGGYRDTDARGEDPVVRGHLNTLIAAMKIVEGVMDFAEIVYE